MNYKISDCQMTAHMLGYKKHPPTTFTSCLRINPIIKKEVKTIHYVTLESFLPLISTFGTKKKEKISNFFSEIRSYLSKVDAMIFSEEDWMNYIFPGSNVRGFTKAYKRPTLREGNRLIPFFLVPLVLDILKVNARDIAHSFKEIRLPDQEQNTLNDNLNYVKSKEKTTEERKDITYIENIKLTEENATLRERLSKKDELLEILTNEKKNLLICIESLTRSQKE